MRQFRSGGHPPRQIDSPSDQIETSTSVGCPHPDGHGNITAACSRGNLTVLAADPPTRGTSPNDTMVYITATSPPSQALTRDPVLASIADDLRRLHTNILFERVGRTDCSLSNYAVLHGIPHYFNIEAETSDASGQAGIIADLVETLRRHGAVSEPKLATR
jgi:hypothetical protein